MTESNTLVAITERQARDAEVAASRKKSDRPELLRLVDLRGASGYMENMLPSDGSLAKEPGKVKESSLDPDTLLVCSFLNPRELFVSVADLKAKIAAEGQREPVDVYSLSGGALEYAKKYINVPTVDENGVSNGFRELTDKDEILVHGERRTRAFRELKKEFAELAPSEINPFAKIRVRHRGVINTRIALVETYNDQTGREGLTTRYEEAKAMEQFRLAGATLAKIATVFGVSIPTVQNRLAIFDLPNNETFGFVQDAVKNYDLTRAKVAKGVANKEDLNSLVAFSDKGIRDLARAFEWTHVATWPLKTGKKAETEPKNYDSYWAEIQARLSTDEPAVTKDVDNSEPKFSVDDVKKVLHSVKLHFRDDAMGPAEMVLRVLLGEDSKVLETYWKPTSV